MYCCGSSNLGWVCYRIRKSNFKEITLLYYIVFHLFDLSKVYEYKVFCNWKIIFGFWKPETQFNIKKKGCLAAQK